MSDLEGNTAAIKALQGNNVRNGGETPENVRDDTAQAYFNSGYEAGRISVLEGRSLRIAAAVETEPFAFAQSSTEELRLEEVLGQAMGAVSMCWLNEDGKRTTGSLEFDSVRAVEIHTRLLDEVRRFMRLDREDAASRAAEFVYGKSGLVKEAELPALRKAIEEKP